MECGNANAMSLGVSVAGYIINSQKIKDKLGLSLFSLIIIKITLKMKKTAKMQ